MALINRISRLFKADFHAVLDHIEEPEVLLKQAIRDMEDDLAGTEKRIKVCMHSQAALKRRKDEVEASIAEYDSQLDLCFESGKDDLAKNLIRKKLEAERFLNRLSSKFDSNAEYLDEQQKMLDDNTATLESLRQKAELFAQQTTVPTGAGDEFDDVAWMTRDSSIDDSEVEIAFLREQDLRSAS
jgi:phage shock protein A